MRFLQIARKDVSSFFNSWTGVLVSGFFFLISGIFFLVLVLEYGRISTEAVKNAYEGVSGLGLTRFVYGNFLGNMGMVLLFLVPLVSMRSLAEERKLETLELLYTYPLSDFQIVLGKYCSLLFIMIVLIVPTAIFSLLLQWLDGSLDWGPIASGYAGLLMLAAAYLALGLFISSLSENQISCAIVSFACLLTLWMLDWISGMSEGVWAVFFLVLSPTKHYREFTFGVIDISNVTYFVFFFAFFFFLTLRSVETRNWKG